MSAASTPSTSSLVAIDSEPTSGLMALPPFARLKQVLRGERAPSDLRETREVLQELARRKAGTLPAELLVDQVLHVTEGTDWLTRRAAMDALLRRVGSAVRDELEVAERPGQGPFGRYLLAGKARAGAVKPKEASKKGKAREAARAHVAKQVRPYQIEVYGLTPVAASCDCADFLRSSLGLCKHLLVVLEDIAVRTKKDGVHAPAPARARAALPLLRWHPVRSWTGPGDRLSGLRWTEAPSSARSGAPAWLRTIRDGVQAGAPRAAVLADLERREAWLSAVLGARDARRAELEPAAAAVLREELERVQRRRAGRAGAREILAHTKTLRRKLYPYQREGIQRFLEEQRLLLADDMGLGKTTQAIAACHALYEAGRIERGLLIVPAALKDQWLREWQATTDRVPLVAVEGRADERVQLYRRTKRGFLVMNYEQLLRDLGSVQRFAPELVVLDEAQRIKNWETKSSAYVMSLTPEWRLVLTGTPMENRLEELATLLDWVDDAALAPKWRLAPWHTTWGSEGRAERIGARHLDTLRERISSCTLRRVRRDVLSQLPPRSDQRVPVEMTSPQREEHDALIVPIAQLLQAGRRRPLRQAEFLKLMQLLAQQRIVSNGMALWRFEDVWPAYDPLKADDALLASTCSPKLAEFRRVIRELVIGQERKVVVFSQWRRMLRLAEWAVRDLLEAEGLSCVFFTGQESQRLRTQNVVTFHDDPSVRVMFLSDAGGVGLNLQRAASACINLELPWNPAVLEQRIGRIYRLGQEHPIDVIHLVSEYGIEARIAGLVGNKQALFSGLFDGTTDAVRFETPASFLGDIERLVEPVEVPTFASDSDGADIADEDAAVGEARATLPVTGRVALPAATESGSAPSTSSVELTPSEEPATGEEPGVEAPMRTPEPAPASHVASLFERIAVTRSADGGLRIDAPPGAAEELSQLLSGLAGLLRSATGAPGKPV